MLLSYSSGSITFFPISFPFFAGNQQIMDPWRFCAAQKLHRWGEHLHEVLIPRGAPANAKLVCNRWSSWVLWDIELVLGDDKWTNDKGTPPCRSWIFGIFGIPGSWWRLSDWNDDFAPWHHRWPPRKPAPRPVRCMGTAPWGSLEENPRSHLTQNDPQQICQICQTLISAHLDSGLEVFYEVCNLHRSISGHLRLAYDMLFASMEWVLEGIALKTMGLSPWNFRVFQWVPDVSIWQFPDSALRCRREAPNLSDAKGLLGLTQHFPEPCGASPLNSARPACHSWPWFTQSIHKIEVVAR